MAAVQPSETGQRELVPFGADAGSQLIASKTLSRAAVALHDTTINTGDLLSGFVSEQPGQGIQWRAGVRRAGRVASGAQRLEDFMSAVYHAVNTTPSETEQSPLERELAVSQQVITQRLEALAGQDLQLQILYVTALTLNKFADIDGLSPEDRRARIEALVAYRNHLLITTAHDIEKRTPELRHPTHTLHDATVLAYQFGTAMGATLLAEAMPELLPSVPAILAKVTGAVRGSLGSRIMLGEGNMGHLEDRYVLNRKKIRRSMQTATQHVAGQEVALRDEGKPNQFDFFMLSLLATVSPVDYKVLMEPLGAYQAMEYVAQNTRPNKPALIPASA